MPDRAARRTRLRERIAELEAELRSARSLDPEERNRLERTVAELREALDREEREEGEAGDHHTVMDHLTEAMRRFEAEHPQLSAALGRVVDALAALGI